MNAYRTSDGLRDLLRLLRIADCARSLSFSQWDVVLRLARHSRLLAVIDQRIADVPGLEAAIPERVTGHLRAARNYVTHRVELLKMELRDLDRALPRDLPIVLLKGAAYVAQDLRVARGRLPGDVDLLVAREHLERAESALIEGGWKTDITDAYDQRYYRRWSHELPPMRIPGHALEVDLHHAITPVTARFQASQELLWSGAAQPRGQRYMVLHPADQIIHAAVHLFQDSNLAGRLRDLVDIDALIRQHLITAEDWNVFCERAAAHGMERPVWYALAHCTKWLGTSTRLSRPLPKPASARIAGMDWIFSRCCPPRLPEEGVGVGIRLACLLATARYHWLRMPVWLLFPHLLRKSLRRLGVQLKTVARPGHIARA
ncbi:MAG TPA: nucleotidyltransferase family protein [Casimicrobiaceae bacterium]|nr:nucleotidyltransferase family protein [Casimicrobiaceae bacterium]